MSDIEYEYSVPAHDPPTPVATPIEAMITPQHFTPLPAANPIQCRISERALAPRAKPPVRRRSLLETLDATVRRAQAWVASRGNLLPIPLADGYANVPLASIADGPVEVEPLDPRFARALAKRQRH